jgi:phospholipid transport system transporter-binding protein
VSASNRASLSAAGPGRYRLEGAITMATVAALRGEGLQAFARGNEAIEVDLAGVQRADSGGLALLIDWLAWARQARRSLRYTSLPQAVRSLARLSDVESMLGADDAGKPVAAGAS